MHVQKMTGLQRPTIQEGPQGLYLALPLPHYVADDRGDIIRARVFTLGGTGGLKDVDFERVRVAYMVDFTVSRGEPRFADPVAHQVSIPGGVEPAVVYEGNLPGGWKSIPNLEALMTRVGNQILADLKSATRGEGPNDGEEAA